jgi:acyl-coenzyme A synthetase/AMP-(fatty) acid ligase
VQAAVSSSLRDIEIILFSDLFALDEYNNNPVIANHDHYRTLHQLLKPTNIRDFRSQSCTLSPDSIATIMATSGTTGLPKMVGRTHRAIVQETGAIEDNNHQKPYAVRRLYCTPIFHAYSFPEMVVNTLRLGYTSYYMPRFDDTFGSKLQTYQITETMAAPPIIMRLADLAQKAPGKAALQSLRQVFCAGAHLPQAVLSKFMHCFAAPIRVIQVWGMSEGGWFTTFKYPEDDDTGSVGRAVSGYQIKLHDKVVTELADGTRASEIYIKGPQLTSSYIGNEKASVEAFEPDGWMKSGDIGYIKQGKVYLVDRVKNCIKVNGWTVSPTEMETALGNSPLVLDSAVVGSGTGLDEHPIVFVVPNSAKVTAEDIRQHLFERLARFKVSRTEIRFTDYLPRSATGKVLRNELLTIVA